ncbi:hypothetical protein C8Q78DRAFT_988721 [Trametes maxima]|nr:hypothetical protein C8Q78DRAFT_988721 [Trametes maxima]
MAQQFNGGNILLFVRAYIWGAPNLQNSRAKCLVQVDYYINVVVSKTPDHGYQHAHSFQLVPSDAMMPQVNPISIASLDIAPASTVAEVISPSQLKVTAEVDLAIPSYLHLTITTCSNSIALVEVSDQPNSFLLQPESANGLAMLNELCGLEHITFGCEYAHAPLLLFYCTVSVTLSFGWRVGLGHPQNPAEPLSTLSSKKTIVHALILLRTRKGHTTMGASYKCAADIPPPLK